MGTCGDARGFTDLLPWRTDEGSPSSDHPQPMRPGTSIETGDSCWGGPFFFIQMADPQFGQSSDNQDSVREAELFEEAMLLSNRLKPAFVVICGDFIHQPGNEEETAEFLRVARTLDESIPLYLVAGNHDITDQPTEEYLRWYRDRFCIDWYSVQHAGCRFIVLNSIIIHDPTMVDGELEKQLKWLEQALGRPRNHESRHTMVFQHHPVFRYDLWEEDQGASIPMERRHALLRLFDEHDVTAVFAGHYHRNGYNSYKNVKLVATGSVCDSRDIDSPGFRIVKVYSDHIEHEYYGLNTMPETITL